MKKDPQRSSLPLRILCERASEAFDATGSLCRFGLTHRAQESPRSRFAVVSCPNESKTRAYAAVNLGLATPLAWAVVGGFFPRGRCLDLFPENESTTMSAIHRTDIGVLKENLDQVTT